MLKGQNVALDQQPRLVLTPHVDVFFRSLVSDSSDPLRYWSSKLCWTRWTYETGINFRYLGLNLSKTTPKEFQRASRIYANKHTTTEYYVLVDDDIFLPPAFDLLALIRLAKSNPEFAIISPIPYPSIIHPWTPEQYTPFVTEDLMEHVSVGGLRVCRQHNLGDWPEMGKTYGYDRIHSKALRQAGLRVGLARKHSVIHLGEGFTSLPAVLC